LFENQPLDIISPVEIHPSMDTIATLEDLFLKTARQVLANVLDGLNAHTLRDPVRCASLRLASSSLTGQFASIARIKAMLDKLITISEQLQRTYSNFEVAKKQDEESTIEIKQALDVQREALRTVDEELASAEKQRAETMTTIEKLNQVLMEVEQKRARLEEMRSTSDLEVRKLEQDLCDAIADASKKAIDVFQKETTELNQRAEQLLIDLNSCRSSNN
jgi:DNA repair exonuclease SbcCD ATPase subunit